MKDKLECLRCKGRMELGYLLDHSQAYHYSVKWVRGPARPSKWVTGTVQVPESISEVETYCCTKCGYLESYVAMEGR